MEWNVADHRNFSSEDAGILEVRNSTKTSSFASGNSTYFQTNFDLATEKGEEELWRARSYVWNIITYLIGHA
jgi:hypothetical protein